jgi:hypothetical protein
MTSGIVLSLCDHSGNMLKPWAAAGYECIAVDILHRGDSVGDDGIRRVGADITEYLPPRADYAAVFAFPPCTHLANSGARWFREKGLAALADALRVVEAAKRICEWSGAPWMLENPMGTLSTYWRSPDYTFDPCDFGGYVDPPTDHYTKRTCLWVGAGFRMPPTRRVPPHEGSKMHLMPPSKDRAQRRSVTPLGFAQAVFEANHKGAV